MQPAVEQTILSMHERYYAPITLRELASEVFISPFHFSRVFTKTTGVTPGRYLTAVRMFEAKRLLLTTSMTVSDVVCSVGYSSVGTFTSRFTRAVGMTPTQYRHAKVGEMLLAVSPGFQRMPSLDDLENLAATQDTRLEGGAVIGHVEMPSGWTSGTLFVGIFGEVIPQCPPAAFTVMADVDTDAVEMVINNVPPGDWTLIAIAQQMGAEALSIGVEQGPVRVRAGETASTDLRVRGLRPTDPPIAVSLAPGVEPIRAKAVRRRTGPIDLSVSADQPEPNVLSTRSG